MRNKTQLRRRHKVVLFDKITTRSSTNNRSPSVEETMKNASMQSRTTLETLPRAVMHTRFVKFIDKASRKVHACHMKAKGEAVKLLKCHVRWVEQQTD